MNKIYLSLSEHIQSRFSQTQKLAMMAILVSEVLLRENKKN